MKTKNASTLQLFNIALALGLCLLVILEVRGLNLLPGEKLYTAIHTKDVVIGLTIYLKTAVDFAILIGILMKNYEGRRHSQMIMAGTAIGNAAGTIAILALWYFFKEITWLLAIMIVLASLVLLKLAETSLEHIDPNDPDEKISPVIIKTKNAIEFVLKPINHVLKPVLGKIVPDLSVNTAKKLTITGLFFMSLKIPFILGLDDFAGYVPLFNIVNVLGFGIGVIVGHAILCGLLFASPKHTIRAVKNPIISIVGSIAFVGLATWGTIEAIKLLTGHH